MWLSASIGGDIMNAQTELKPYDEIRTAKNAYKLIVESGRSIESVA